MEALSYNGEVKVTFHQSRSKDALYFRIELEDTIWTPFIGDTDAIQKQSFFDKWFWDPITPVYNPLVTLINGICSFILGKKPLSYHIDQASALKALAAIRQIYIDNFGIYIGNFRSGDIVSELQGLEKIYCTKDGMENYMDGRPRSRAAVLGNLLRDAARPIASALTDEIRHSLPYYSFPSTTTPWTGMVGYTKRTHMFLGRVANGGGREVGYSESGMIYTPYMRKRGYGKEATFALLIHAWLFKNLNFPVDRAPVTHFTATVSPDNQITSGLANALGAEILDTDLNPYDPTSQRHLYGINADQIDDLVARIIKGSITINDRGPIDFFKNPIENKL